MLQLVTMIDAYGGIAARRELIAAGIPADWIIIAMRGGSIERIRNGWYAAPDEPDQLKQAWRVGGRLGCVSAANFHGEKLPTGGLLHVNVSRRSAGLRQPDDKRRKLSAQWNPRLVIHWVDEPSMQDLQPWLRKAAPLETALEQAHVCAQARAAARVAAADNAARQRKR